MFHRTTKCKSLLKIYLTFTCTFMYDVDPNIAQTEPHAYMLMHLFMIMIQLSQFYDTVLNHTFANFWRVRRNWCTCFGLFSEEILYHTCTHFCRVLRSECICFGQKTQFFGQFKRLKFLLSQKRMFRVGNTIFLFLGTLIIPSWDNLETSVYPATPNTYKKVQLLYVTLIEIYNVTCINIFVLSELSENFNTLNKNFHSTESTFFRSMYVTSKF